MSSQTRPDLFDRMSRPFMVGVFGLLPLALTLGVLAWMVGFLHDVVGPGTVFGSVLRSIGLSVVTCEVIAYAVGLVTTFALVYFFGVLLQSGVTRRWQSSFDNTLQKLPLVSSIYDTAKHLKTMFERKDDRMQTMTPVLCRFGGPNGAVALALMPSPEPVQIDGGDYHAVIIPTAPVPFGGALLLVPAEWVEPTHCGFREVVSIYMSMGGSAAEHLSGRASSVSSGAAETRDPG
ncbi:hypothetical protein MYXO_02224 [Myxococcaceae bacterium]|nr:hypothetical protein MYXO_02224 [Myxococcaceae bacterium]